MIRQLAAIIDLERLSRDLMHEKAQKRKLQGRIKQMSEKLLDGGTSLEETREFKVALRKVNVCVAVLIKVVDAYYGG